MLASLLVTDSVYVGNADEDAADDRGWLLGHFKSDGDVRHSTDVEIKWGVHPRGDERGQWVVGEKRTALLVDELLGQQQVVAKTLGAALGKVPGVSGGAILGDGRVGLILDVTETVALAQSQDVAPLRRDRDRSRDVAA